MGPFERLAIFAGTATEAPWARALERYEIALSCRASPQRPGPEANEDAVAAAALGERGVLAVVSDGVGGHGNGDFAARRLVDTLTGERLRSAAEGELVPGGMAGAVIGAIEAVNRELIEAAGTPAATVVVATIIDDEIRTYHVGDAEALLVGQRGRLKLHTIKHGPAGYAEASGALDERGALTHPERHLVSNMVGMAGMRVEVNTAIDMGARDTLVIGSDGLFDKLLREQIAELVRQGPLAEAALELERAIDARAAADGHGDDASFVLLRRR